MCSALSEGDSSLALGPVVHHVGSDAKERGEPRDASGSFVIELELDDGPNRRRGFPLVILEPSADLEYLGLISE